jgi:hypothetical protein
MSIPIKCPECRFRLNVAGRAGSRIECPQCEATLTVPAADPDELEPVSKPPKRSEPAARRRARERDRDRDDDESSPAQNGSMTWILVAGGVGVFLLVSVGVALGIRSARSEPEEVVTAPPPKPPVATPPPPKPLGGEEVYLRLLRSAALIEQPLGSGSGFVVDANKRLVATNFHVVGSAQSVSVIFPLYDDKGAVLTDAREYRRRAGNIAIKGEVLASEAGCDLALIRVERLPENVTAVALSQNHAPTGARVFSVGGSGVSDNLLWRLTEGSVRGRGQRQTRADFGTVDCMILETSAPVNPGDSGGPVMNESGQVVAVVSHFNSRERQVSGNIDVDELRKFITRHTSGWAPNPASKNRGKIEGTRWTSLPATVNGQPVAAETFRLDFSSTGGLVYVAGPATVRGTYSLGAGDTVTLHLEEAVAGSKTHVQTVTITGERLTMRDTEGATITFRKRQ